jgi:8-oxo-dGTP pyrophosphatase MutT (NUDIX family)
MREAATWGPTLQPSTVVKVYHGTSAGQITHLINGFDANKVVYHHFNAPRHAGLFVAPDLKGTGKFGDVVFEIVTAAKHLHGTNYGGAIGRRDPTFTDGDGLQEKYPDSFRPTLSFSLDPDRPEPQALLRGLVRPSQIKRVQWDGKWYSRKAFLAEHGPSLRLRDLGIDLSYPSLSVPDLFEAVEKAHGLQPSKAEQIYKENWERGGAPKIKGLLEMSKFGPTAIRSYVDKLDEYFTSAKVARVYRRLAKAADEWVAAGVVVENLDGKILLLKRGPTAPWMPGKWNTPGGNVDPGENPAAAARREVLEEAGLRVGDMQLLTTLRQGGGKAYMFHTTDWSGTPRHDWESTDLRWVSKGDAPRYDLIPGVNRVLDMVRRESTSPHRVAARKMAAMVADLYLEKQP